MHHVRTTGGAVRVQVAPFCFASCSIQPRLLVISGVCFVRVFHGDAVVFIQFDVSWLFWCFAPGCLFGPVVLPKLTTQD